MPKHLRGAGSLYTRQSSVGPAVDPIFTRRRLGGSAVVAIVFVLLLTSIRPAHAWKPSTHVYLALQALDEITNVHDMLGNAKAEGEVVFYRVNYESGEVLERIGTYEANMQLVNALQTHRRAFVTGVLGPDAYPDIATGQQRIHVRHPVYTDRWLRYLWDQAQGKDAVITAFVFGYLVHATGDMFMHTYVNHYAGGPFAADVHRVAGNPLNFNAARHVVLESYIGKRAPELNRVDYDIGPSLEPVLREFIYRHLTDARTLDHPDLDPRGARTLGDSVMVIKPYGQFTGGLDYESAVPRFFSNLRDGLTGYLTLVDDTVAAIDGRIDRIFADAAEQSCPANVTCASPLEEQTPSCVGACGLAATAAAPHAAYRTAFLGAHAAPYNYVKLEWVPNIDDGLRRWLDLNHQFARKLLYHPEGESDLTGARDAASVYADVYLPGMLGAPSVVGEFAAFSQAIKDMIFGDVQEQLDALRANVLRTLFVWAFQMTPEEFQDLYASPQAVFDDILPFSYTSEEGAAAATITLSELNQELGIDDPAFIFPESTWNPLSFPPAFNTITLTKIMLLSESGLQQLVADLGGECPNGVCLPAGNAMLGFMRSLDESRQWLPDDVTEELDAPEFDAYKHSLHGFLFEPCSPYRQIFMEQLGDDVAAYAAEGRSVESRPCPPVEPLDAPVVTPDGGTFADPITVAISPPLNLSESEQTDLELYYTLQVSGSVVEPVRPTAESADSRVHPYTEPFDVFPPLDPDQLPITLRAKAYHPGYLPSETVVADFDIDARVATPAFSRASGEYLEPFTVSIAVPDDPGGTVIFYTLTGDTPDYNDTPYTGPLQLSRGSYTLKAAAYRIGYVRSEVASADYRIYAPDEVERAEPPFFVSPRGSGTYADAVQVAMDTHTQDGRIRWTIGEDGLPAFDPTETLGNAYSGPFNLSKGNWFIRAITVKEGLFPSELSQINVEVVDPLGTTAAPTVSPAGGVFENDVEVQLTAAVTFVNNEGQTVTDSSGMQLQYTLDGSDPDINPGFNPAANRRYTGPFALRRSSTLRALAYRTFFPVSEVTEVVFEFVCATPGISPASGIFYDSVRVDLNSITENARIRYTLDGSEPTEESALFTEPFTLSSSTTVRARAYKNGYTFSDVATESFVIEQGASPAIARHPQSVEALIGTTAVFAVRASGSPEPAHQWLFDGEPVEGADTDSLAIDDVQASDEGAYAVRLSNIAGEVTSESATLSVVAEPMAPVITMDLTARMEVEQGRPVSFGVEASGSPTPTFRWVRNATVLPSRSTPSISYAAADLSHAGSYGVTVQNVAGTVVSTEMQLVIRLAANVAVEEGGEAPETFDLGQNYPNPFNPMTTIPFSVPTAAHVHLTIFDVTGRQIAVVVSRAFAPGRYTASFDGSGLASGVYFYRLQAQEWSEVKKLVLVE